MSSEQERRVVLNGQPLAYRLRRSARRRSIGLKINSEGLLITAPPHAGQIDIDNALHAKADWIFRYLNQIDTLPKRQALQAGSLVDYLGQAHPLLIQHGRHGVQRSDDCLLVALPDPAAIETLPKVLERWFKAQAIPYFSSRVRIYAERLGVQAPLVSLTSAKTRWGSCNHKGEIRLHWRLMQAEPAVIDYVVAHELAHILELNHSPRFWAHVERVFPHWKPVRARLKKEGSRYWRW